MSRPTKLTDEVFEELVKRRRIGVSVLHCAKGVGISRRVVYDWLDLGRRDVEDDKPDTLYGRFYTEMERARGDAVARRIGRIEMAGRRDWRADAWYLQHCERGFGDKVEVEVTERGSLGVDDAALEHMDDDELAALREKLAAAKKLEAEIRELTEQAKERA